MISFSKLGQMGRLGNQLFQYAFLRTAAQRLGVKFYCPPWIGDEVFLLQDSKEKAEKPVNIRVAYREPVSYTGFNEAAMDIADETDILGWFQTEKYWDRNTIQKWYQFRENKIQRILEKYRQVDFANSTGIHLRFGDKLSDIGQRATYYVAPPDYYARAISLTGTSKQIVVFSDEVETAKNHLRGVKGECLFIEGNNPYEDLYLMTRCHGFVISVSTISWWGGFLNESPDAIIVAPAEGPYRPGCYIKNKDYLCQDWVKINAMKQYSDHYLVVLAQELIRHPLGAISIAQRKLLRR
jgi:hypothetical protein